MKTRKKSSPRLTAGFCRHGFMAVFLLFLVLSFNPAAAGDRVTLRNMVLLDFESDQQLDNLDWHCGTIYQRVREHAADGNFSLKIEMYPKVEWPGFGTPIKTDLSSCRTLQITIFNPAQEAIKLSYRIDDRVDNPLYGDRVNGQKNIDPGFNTIIFDLEKLRTSGSKRPLDRSRINRLYLFLHRPAGKKILYLDHLIAK